MNSRVCGLLVGLAFVAVACSGTDTDATASAPTSAPAVEAPTAEAPTAEAPTAEAPTAEALAAEAPTAEALAAEAPTAETPEAATSAVESGQDASQLDPRERGALRNYLGYEFPPAPEAPAGPIAQTAIDDLETIWAGFEVGVDPAAIISLGEAGDSRLAWIISDLLRFFWSGELHDASVSAFQKLTGARVADDPVSDLSRWQSVTDHLIAWDLPAFDRYPEYKGRLFTLLEPGWQPFFDDPDAHIDWRLLSWGGVFIDDRELGDTNVCARGCIPAIDDPAVTDAAGGSWYADDGIVFAVAIGDEARAYPRHVMEIHEMVNDTLGGRRIGMPYCTLCGSAQAYFTDDVPDGVTTPILRTSGLLSRSNKVMYDLVTKSMFDTFTGEAVSGPLRQRGVVLNQATVVTTTWGEWKAAHPETTIIAEDGGLGRRYSLDPLQGRDDDGPIFPIGDLDGRLGVHDQVFGVVLDDGTPIAFGVAAAAAALEAGRSVELGGVTLRLDGGGVRAVDAAGDEVEGHQSFWFAWSQFMPDTLLWEP